jgi:putative transposase
MSRGAGRRTIFQADAYRQLFMARFKAILVDADHYLAHLSRYIHLNPVVAKITETAHTYRCSSYRAYLRSTPAPA